MPLRGVNWEWVFFLGGVAPVYVLYFPCGGV